MNRSADTASTKVWRRRLAQQRRSGLSVAAFCRDEALAPASFYAWRKRLANVDSRQAVQAPPLFVPVEVASWESLRRGVQIELPGGAIVTLPSESSADVITTAIRAAMVRTDAKQDSRPC